MGNLLEISIANVGFIFFSGLGVYIAVIGFTRLFGKRSFSKMSSFDFVMTLAIGSVIATTILPDSVTLVEGVLALFFIYSIKAAAAYLRRFPIIENLMDNQPLILMRNTTIFHENLKKAHVTETDLRSKLREANVLQLSQVRAVIFETTGDIVVIHCKDEKNILDKWIIQDVNLS